MDGDTSPSQPLDGLAIEAVGGLALTDEGPGARLDPERPVRAAGLRPLGEAPEGGGGDVRPVAADGGLDQLDQRPGDESQVVVLTRRLGRGQCCLVLTETVVEQGAGVLAPGQRSALTPIGRVLEGELEKGRRLGPSAAPGREQDLGVHERGAADRSDERGPFLDQNRRGGELAGV